MKEYERAKTDGRKLRAKESIYTAGVSLKSETTKGSVRTTS